jgi:hypothetical protein
MSSFQLISYQFSAWSGCLRNQAGYNSKMSDSHIHAFCAICGHAIRSGEDVVSIQRNLEHIDGDGMSHSVQDSVLLASLCALCGPKYPEKRISVIFGSDGPATQS